VPQTANVEDTENQCWNMSEREFEENCDHQAHLPQALHPKKTSSMINGSQSEIVFIGKIPPSSSALKDRFA